MHASVLCVFYGVCIHICVHLGSFVNKHTNSMSAFLCVCFFSSLSVLILLGFIFGRHLRVVKTGAKLSSIPWLLVRERQHTGFTNERRLGFSVLTDWHTARLPKTWPTNGHPCLRITYCLFSEWVWEIKIRAYLCTSEVARTWLANRVGAGTMVGTGDRQIGVDVGWCNAYTSRSWARFLLTSALTASTF